MLSRIRDRLLAFATSGKDVPLLAGFSVGFYLIIFVYARNFGLLASLPQLLFFVSYYALLPMALLYIGYRLMGKTGLHAWRRHFLFVGIIGFFAFFFIEFNRLGFSKKLTVAAIIIAAALLSVWLRNYYKVLILALFFMSVFNMPKLAKAVWVIASNNKEWQEQPDGIEQVLLKHKPNIYYIQPDGYASFDNLKDTLHAFDNSRYEAFLEKSGFTLYRDYRANYPSTLLSNSATFAMKHHYAQPDVDAYHARDLIVGDNAVLRVLKNNGYTTSFITENPYLLMNRPHMGYDHCNINYSEMPFIGQGARIVKDVFADLKNAMAKTAVGPQFYFIEKFTPSHIHNNAPQSLGKEQERVAYLDQLQKANEWLEQVVAYIQKHDPDALIIIGADHGGYVGFEYMGQGYTLTGNKTLAESIFGAQLAIKWNGPGHDVCDDGLQSGVNLFRSVFAFLSQDQKYLQHQQDNSSYMPTEQGPVYQYIDNSGTVVFKPYKN